jgi:stearoyl-CoA desaturase (Delta-9 desaturase)
MTHGEIHLRPTLPDPLREGDVVVWNRGTLPNRLQAFNWNQLREQVMPDFGSWASAWWEPVLFIIVAGHLTNVSVTLFLHRAQTHRGVKLHYLAALPMRIWLWLSTAIVTKEWVACHRKHHAFADREGDPHSPLMEGLRNVVLKGAFYYRKAVRQPGVLDKYGKGTPNDWLERHLLSPLNWLGIVIMMIVDIYLFGFFVGPLVWGVQMIWIPFWAAGIVNGIGHAVGYRNFNVKDESRNISPIAIWLGGEELHNNHHADPHSAKFKAKWYELDIGWIYLRLLSFFGLAEIAYARR